ncbi:MAG: ATP-binding protein [Bacteroidales bacterium]|nr:ATP-binding protein [Bacteroidales bacterium]
MEIYRTIIEKLREWKLRSNRKPLIISGVRQTGKTWIMKHFGKEEFEATAYFNFDIDDGLQSVFANHKNPLRILEELKLYTDVEITAGKTLIIFDEIQECGEALNSLKYFCEDAPQYHIVAAGSLLGVALNKVKSFPVGKVEFLDIYPLSFKEFLIAKDAKTFNFVDNLERIEPLPEIIFNKLGEYYRQYMAVGGMPEAVNSFLSNASMDDVDKCLDYILSAYSRDFSKHAQGKDVPKILSIWDSVPSQLAKENRKFVFKLVRPGARAREYEDALLWLNSAGMIFRVFRNTKPALPLKAYDDVSAFKIYLCDVGLLRRLSSLPAEIVISQNPLYAEFKGASAENYVLQSLVQQVEPTPRYWVSEGKAEVDFLIQYKTEIIPVEVKSGGNLMGKSLAVYGQKFNPRIKLKFSLNNLAVYQNVINIPLFLADWTTKLVDKV